jgi:hypothetical protein
MGHQSWKVLCGRSQTPPPPPPGLNTRGCHTCRVATMLLGLRTQHPPVLQTEAPQGAGSGQLHPLQKVCNLHPSSWCWGLVCYAINLHGGATLAWALMQMLVMCASDPSLTYMLCCAMLLLCVTELSFGASSSGRRGVTSPVPPDGSSTALHQHSPGGLSRLRSAHNSLVTGQGAESFTSCFESAVGDGYWFAH